jgi:hypothetical protein
MPQIIRYRNRGKGVSIKFRNPITESHALDIEKNSHPRLLMLTDRMVWDTQQGCAAPGAQE